jgi:branched-chain amino acid aminotransferase
MTDIKIQRAEKTRYNDVDWNNLRFGVYFSDHIFVSDYINGKWDGGRIEPYGEMGFEPALCTLHYGQTVFEGLKAFRDVKGGANIFRPDENAKRMNNSSDMVCIPKFDEKLMVEGISELVKIDKKFIPDKKGQSLYIRPFVFGTGNFLGVSASPTYRLIVITSPVGSYYASGLEPVKIMVESNYVRAVQGGLGLAKTAANYAASLKAGEIAHEKGFSQVLWLDGVHRKLIDEVGAMNIMFVIGDELVTPSLDRGTILNGITRKSALQIAREWGMKVTERDITIDEIIDNYRSGKLKEIFGTGTAAVISPVGLLEYKGEDMIINDNKIGPVAQKIYNEITGIQYGEIEDKHKWNVHLDI